MSKQASTSQEHASTNEAHKSRLEYLWKVHSYTNDYIRFADTKAAFICGVLGLLTGALISTGVFDSLHRIPVAEWPRRVRVAVPALACMVTSFLFALWSVKPRLNSPAGKGFIFWDSVCAYGDCSSYSSACNQLSPSAMEDSVCSHVFVLARIARRKFFWSNLAMLVGTAGGLLAGVAILLQHLAK